MVGCDNQRRRIVEGLVRRQEPRLDVPVRRHDRQSARPFIELTRDAAYLRIGIEAAIGMDHAACSTILLGAAVTGSNLGASRWMIAQATRYAEPQ